MASPYDAHYRNVDKSEALIRSVVEIPSNPDADFDEVKQENAYLRSYVSLLREHIDVQKHVLTVCREHDQGRDSLIGDLRTQTMWMTADIDAKKNQIESLATEKQGLQAAINDHVALLGACAHTMKESKGQIEEKDEELDMLYKEYNALEEEYEDCCETNAGLEKCVDSLKEQLKCMGTVMDTMAASHRTKLHEHQRVADQKVNHSAGLSCLMAAALTRIKRISRSTTTLDRPGDIRRVLEDLNVRMRRLREQCYGPPLSENNALPISLQLIRL